MSAELVEMVARYRRTIASRYRALKSEELSEVPDGSMWISPKIDGELWFAVIEERRAVLLNSSGRILDRGPLVEELAAVSGRVKGRTVLAGELFAAAAKGSRPRVGDVAAALAEGGSAIDRLGWQAFDALEIDGVAAPSAYGERWPTLARVLDGGKRATPVKTVVTNDRAELHARWEEWGASGKAEGMIVRAHDGRIFKVKPGFTVDAVVVGYTPRGEAPDQLRTLLVALMRKDGSFQLLGGLGNLGTESQRKSMLATLEPVECPSRFRHTSGDGGLVRWVAPRIVVEIACTDVQAEDSEGLPIKRWALRHGPSGWDPIGPSPCASLIHPGLVRVRADKQVNDVDVRIAQLSERCQVASINAAAAALELPKSVVARREIWTKETKGKVAVRKLLVWQTNKQVAAPGWPAWIVHFTDYSPDRKNPLERTVKTAVTADEAEIVAEGLVTENVKKGWERVGASAPSASLGTAASEEVELQPEKAAKPKKPIKNVVEDQSDSEAVPKKTRSKKKT
jgi:hypothetical protein